MKKIFYILTSFALAVALAGSAKATVISPPTIELDANRGDQLANTIKLKNDGEKTETYFLSTQAFKALGEEGKPQFTDDKTGIVAWTSFDITSITLQPGQATTIPFKIQVPLTAAAGGYYEAVFATTTPPTVEGTGVGITARIGTLILLRVAGETNESARIVEFSSDKDTYSTLPVNFTARIENNGNVHLKPYGEIVVRNMWGSEATRVKVNVDGGNVLPNSIRKFTSTWGEETGASGFWARYSQERKERLFGKYSAELTVVYGQNNIAKSAIQFWVIPTERIIVNIVLLIVLVVVLVFLVRKYNEWLISQYNSKRSGASPFNKPGMKK